LKLSEKTLGMQKDVIPTPAHVFVVPTPLPGRRARKMGGDPKDLQPPPQGAKMGAVLNKS